MISHGGSTALVAVSREVTERTQAEESPKTKAHIRRIIARLGVSDRTQAAVRATELVLLNIWLGRGPFAPS